MTEKTVARSNHIVEPRQFFLIRYPAVPAVIAALYHASLAIFRYFFPIEGLINFDYRFGTAAVCATVLLLLLRHKPVVIRRGQVMAGLLMIVYLVSVRAAVTAEGKGMLPNNYKSLFDAFMSLIVFLALGHYAGRVRSQKIVKMILHVVVALWSIFFLYVITNVYRKHIITTPSGGFIYIDKTKALSLNCNTNTTGVILLTFCFLSLLLFVWENNTILKILCISEAVINYLGLVMSLSRACIASFIICGTITVFLYERGVRYHSYKKTESGQAVSSLRPQLYALVFLIITIGSLYPIYKSYEKSGDLPKTEKQGLEMTIQSVARGEDAELERQQIRNSTVLSEDNLAGYRLYQEGVIRNISHVSYSSIMPRSPHLMGIRSERKEILVFAAGYSSSLDDLDGNRLYTRIDRFLSGRLRIWRVALKAMFVSPRRFLLGATPHGVWNAVLTASNGKINMYTHNQILEIGVALGVPSMVLFLFFIIYMARSSASYVLSHPEDRETLMAASFIAIMLLFNLFEATLLFYRFINSYPFFFFVGWLEEKALRK